MENSAERQPVKLPKSAYTPPQQWHAICTIILIILSAPAFLVATGLATTTLFLLPVFLPIQILGMIAAHETGLSLSKMNYDSIKLGSHNDIKTRIWLYYFIALFGGVSFQLLLYGFPIRQCWATCQEVPLFEVICIDLVCTGILFLPAFVAINHYKNWVTKNNLPRPGTSNEHQNNRS